MSKFTLLLSLSLTFLMASRTDDFKRAQELEQSGDIKAAMQIYKELAKGSLSEQEAVKIYKMHLASSFINLTTFCQ